MKNFDYLIILVALFILRIILLSGSYADAICLMSILAYKLAKEYLTNKRVSNNILDVIKKNEELNHVRFETLSQELVKVKNNNEAIKAAVNFNKR